MGFFQRSGKFPKYIDLYLYTYICSQLPVVSEIIEKVIFKQLYEYLTDSNLLAVSQHGFRPMHSTLTALLEVTNNWYLDIDDGLLNSVLFLDLKKAC